MEKNIGEIYINKNGIRYRWDGKKGRKLCLRCDYIEMKDGYCKICSAEHSREEIEKIKKQRPIGEIIIGDDKIRRKWDGKTLRKICFECDAYSNPDGYCNKCSSGKKREVPIKKNNKSRYPPKEQRKKGEVYDTEPFRKKWDGKALRKACFKCSAYANPDGYCDMCTEETERPMSNYPKKYEERVVGQIYMVNGIKKRWMNCNTFYIPKDIELEYIPVIKLDVLPSERVEGIELLNELLSKFL